jgi:hypothetical protein
MFSKDLFDLNAQPMLSPTVQVVNATANAGFFHSAYIPHKVDKPYFRLSGNFMMGHVRNDMKEFSPSIPTREYNNADVGKYITFGITPPYYSIIDTAGFINYLFQNLLYIGIADGSIKVPGKSATALGGAGATIDLRENNALLTALQKHPLYNLLSAASSEQLAMLEGVIQSIPDFYVFPSGGDISNMAAGVPQLEVGSLWGTELLIRYIPKVNLGQWVGDFSFWGIGLKHSISQYFWDDPNRDGNANERPDIAPFDLSIQAVIQGTSLENEVGITEVALKADASIIDINIHFSKNFNNWFELYTGLSYERTKIDGSCSYLLPVQLQAPLGLMTWEYPDPPDPNNPYSRHGTGAIIKAPGNLGPNGEWEFPGDDVFQTSDVSITDSQVKWVIGANKNIGPVTIYVDYSVSKFNIFCGGIQYRF